MSSDINVEKTIKNISRSGFAVLNVGNPGNKGGSGRPKEAVREYAREEYTKRIPKLLEIIDNPETSEGIAIKAMMALVEITGLKQADTTSGDEPIRPQVNFGDMSLEERKQFIKELREGK